MTKFSNGFTKFSNRLVFRNWPGHILRASFCVSFLYTLVITAWFTDDAYILFRHVANFVNGDGIVFNFGQRIQGFSTPLWFLLISFISMFLKHILMSAMVTSIVLSMAAFLVLYKIECKLSNSNLPLFSPLLLLLFSISFCDFSTSGLENSLSHFIISVILLVTVLDNWNRYRKLFFVLAALLILTRLDNILLILPITILLIKTEYSLSSKSLVGLTRDLIPGALVFTVWITFSTFYFGFPLPNTYYAKLSSGLPLEEYLIRGLYYIRDLMYDPASFIIMVSSLIISLGSKNKTNIAISMGVILYLLYIIYIGGDFMRGRFFSVLVFVSVGQMIIALSSKGIGTQFKHYYKALILAALIGTSIAGYPVPFLSNLDYTGQIRNPDEIAEIGMQDQRGLYFDTFGMMSPQREWPEVVDLKSGIPDQYEILCGHIGGTSLARESKIIQKSVGDAHLIDFCALVDPLLARLPSIKDRFWRVGHNYRKVPTGYGEFLIGNIDELPDKSLNKLANDLKLATMGPLFSIERLWAVWRLNTGNYENLNSTKYANPQIWVPKTTNIEAVQIDNWNVAVDEYGKPNVSIHSKSRSLATGLTFLVNSSYVYDIHVNGELMAKSYTVDHPHTGYINLEFVHPINVSSVTISTVGINHFIRKWWMYPDKIKFESLWIED